MTAKQHDCADRGCLAAMFGLDVLGAATASNAEEGSSSNGSTSAQRLG
jgi:hypothetical protein